MFAGGRGGGNGTGAQNGSGPTPSRGLGGQGDNFPPGGTRGNNGGGGGCYGGGGGGLADMHNNGTKGVSIRNNINMCYCCIDSTTTRIMA